MSETSGWQLSGDAPTAYTRFALKIMEPWTDDLILAAQCRDGDHVLDVGCGTGLVANRTIWSAESSARSPESISTRAC